MCAAASTVEDSIISVSANKVKSEIERKDENNSHSMFISDRSGTRFDPVLASPSFYVSTFLSTLSKILSSTDINATINIRKVSPCSAHAASLFIVVSSDP